MTEVVWSPWLVQVAHAFLLLSFIQWNQLYLRITVLGANISFACLGIFIFTISLDLIWWNSIQAVINIFHISRILYKQKKIKFENQLEELYVNVFSDVLTRWEYKLLLEKCIKKKQANAKDTQIIKAGNPFSDIIIIGNYEEGSEVELKKKVGEQEEVISSNLERWSWVGTIEYVTLYEEGLRLHVAGTDSEIRYGVTLTLRNLPIKEKPFVYYKLNVDKMLRLFKHPGHGNAISKGILAKMLGHCSKIVIQRQEEYSSIVSNVIYSQGLLNRDQDLPRLNRQKTLLSQMNRGTTTGKTGSAENSDYIELPNISFDEEPRQLY